MSKKAADEVLEFFIKQCKNTRDSSTRRVSVVGGSENGQKEQL